VGDSSISARRRLHGLPLALALPLMGAGVSAQTSGRGPAGTPVPDDGGVNLESLARMIRLPDLPAGAEISLDRIAYPPGIMLNLPAAGPVAYVVEQGALDVRMPNDNPARIVLSGGRDHFQETRDGYTRVLAGGSVYAPAGGLEITRNASAAPTVALVMRVDPYADSGAAVVTAAATGEPRGARHRRRNRAAAIPAATEADVEPLADLPFAPGLEPDVRASLYRISYPPGAMHVFGDAGPTLLTVEQGVVDLLYEPGNPPGVGFSGTGGRLPTTPDGFVRLPVGASVSARDGRMGMTRNSSGAPASLLVVLLELDDDASGSYGSSVVVGRREAQGPPRRRSRDGDTPSATISPHPDGVPLWTDLTETGPLPGIPAGATAALRRITIEPGDVLDIGYLGPTLYYVEQGTLVVDAAHRRLAFVGSDSAGGKRGISIGRRGEVPAGVGVYAADGDLGPARNAGSDDLVILALLIVPQPGGAAIEQAGGGATVVATPGEPLGEKRTRRHNTRAPAA
jgi:hypothetical protein